MKLHRIAILRIIFLFAALTCAGIPVYSNYQNSAYCLEFPAGTNGVENRYSSEVHASDDDQFNHSNGTALIKDFDSEIQYLQDCSFFLKFSFAVWQPPKIS